MTKFFLRFRGALALLPYTYEDIEADKTAFSQALIVVILSSVATGIAYFPDGNVSAVLAGVVGALLGWLIWSWLTYYIGSHWLAGPDTEADWGATAANDRLRHRPRHLSRVGPDHRNP
ncbi:MAG: hypothetical protein O2968_09115 [Acidobacteria bacterium]|nr:hypothetical protein [Acidobacteriota bacterium]